ncbi:MAG: thiamine phosphate synthase [Hyphomicrobiaceae bacterium]
MSGIDVFYPIVPNLGWLDRLVSLGVRTIQLRLKDATPDEIARQIDGSLDICSRRGCQLIVNDHWQAALHAGADYVHLGQEDLDTADLAALKANGVRIGLSSHSPEELDIALAAKPDYIALGPIWETKLKTMKWAPQGLERIGEWKRRMGEIPLVAIAGITIERAPMVLAAGADSAAVITDFITHADPEARVRQWLAWAASARLSSK